MRLTAFSSVHFSPAPDVCERRRLSIAAPLAARRAASTKRSSTLVSSYVHSNDIPTLESASYAPSTSTRNTRQLERNSRTLKRSSSSSAVGSNALHWIVARVSSASVHRFVFGAKAGPQHWLRR